MLSLVIPSYNSRLTIRFCLDSLRHLIGRSDVEVIVVDSSTDGTDEYIRASFPGVCLVRLTQQTHAGKTRNAGARVARGERLAFVDADCVVPLDWLETVLHSFSCHPDQDACVAGIDNHNPGSLVGWVSFLTEFNGYAGRQRRRTTRHLPSYCMIIRRTVFDAAGGFPEDAVWLEDMILTARLLEMGARLYIEPAIRVAHHNRTRWSDFLRHQYQLGYAFAQSRFRSALPGSAALRKTPFAIPALAGWRACRAYERTFRSHVGMGLLLMLLTPGYIVGMLVWMAGVWAGRSDCVQPVPMQAGVC